MVIQAPRNLKVVLSHLVLFQPSCLPGILTPFPNTAYIDTVIDSGVRSHVRILRCQPYYANLGLLPGKQA